MIHRPEGADARSLIETTPSTRTDPASTRPAGPVTPRNVFGAPLPLNRTLTVSTACFSTAVDGAVADLHGWYWSSRRSNGYRRTGGRLVTRVGKPRFAPISGPATSACDSARSL